jgi:hypothetical protein
MCKNAAEQLVIDLAFTIEGKKEPGMFKNSTPACLKIAHLAFTIEGKEEPSPPFPKCSRISKNSTLAGEGAA